MTVKQINSPTCHPLSESLKASNSYQPTSAVLQSLQHSGRHSPSDTRSRRSSRVSDGSQYDFGGRNDDELLFRTNAVNVDVQEGTNSSDGQEHKATGSKSSSKTLSSIWLIEFELIQLGKKIAAGGSGQLFEARYVGTDVAVKELFTALIDSENIEDFKREVRFFFFFNLVNF